MSKSKELSGVLFKNDKRTTDKHPMYRGSCLIAGVEFKIAAWVNEGTNGKYMSLKFEPKDQPETRQQPYRLIPKTVLKILRGERLQLHGGGESKRSFLHVDDMAQAIRLAAEHGVPGRTYHCAGNDLMRINAVVQAVCNELQVGYSDFVEDVPERPGKDPAYWLDDARIRETLGWAPQVHFGEGLAATVAWFKANAGRYAGKPLEYEHRP